VTSTQIKDCRIFLQNSSFSHLKYKKLRYDNHVYIFYHECSFTKSQLCLRHDPTSEASCNLTGGHALQSSAVTVENILVARVGARAGVLPKCREWPTSRKSTDGRSISGNPEWVRGAKAAVVARAGCPPISGGVDHWITASPGLVGVRKVVDPGNHGRGAQAVASRAIRIVLDIESSWESPAIGGPATSVSQEVVGLCGARGYIGASEMVSTADDVVIRGTRVLARELRVNISCSFGRLDICELDTVCLDGRPVNVGLVARDIDTLRSSALGEFSEVCFRNRYESKRDD